MVSATDSLPSYTAANTVYLYNFEHDEEIVVKDISEFDDSNPAIEELRTYFLGK